MKELLVPLKSVKEVAKQVRVEQVTGQLDKLAEGRRRLLSNLQTANSLSDADRRKHRSVLSFLETGRKELFVSDITEGEAAFALLKERYDAAVARLKRETEKVQNELHELFAFVEEAFGEENEMLILVTELTVNSFSARFIAAFGSEDYSRHNKELLLSERKEDIRAQIAELKLD